MVSAQYMLGGKRPHNNTSHLQVLTPGQTTRPMEQSFSPAVHRQHPFCFVQSTGEGEKEEEGLTPQGPTPSTLCLCTLGSQTQTFAENR